jgi:hypothetical protein
MNDTRIRPGDIVLALALTALGVVLMLGNISGEDGTRVDTTSWVIVPVFAATTLPILFRRRGMIAVLGVSLAAMAVHDVAFGWMVRCGAGLPLSFAMAYGVGRLLRGRDTWVGAAMVAGLQALVLVRDSAAGLEIIPVTLVIAAACWGAGALLQRRSERAEAPSYDDRVATTV